ncbi:MAG: iron chaperone [Acidimicrobiia bacterium]
MSAKKATKKAVKSTTAKGKTSQVFTDEERAAMKDRVREMKSVAAEGDSAVLAKIAEMSESDRDMGKRIHEIVKANAPELVPKLWYGMPAYAKDGKVVCFFQDAAKFKARYATFGFNDAAKLDEGGMWPTSYALKKLTAADEKAIGALVKKAVS